MTRRLELSLAALCLAIAVEAASQTRATSADLAGIIVDQSAAALPGAIVTARNAETNYTRSATTDAGGPLLDSRAAPRDYDVRVELTGFTPRTQEDVVLTVGGLVDVRLTLNVAGGQETDHRCR